MTSELNELVFSGLTGKEDMSVDEGNVSWMYCFYSVVQKWVAPINVKFATGERSAVPNFMFIGIEVWKYSPKTVKISNFGHKFAPQGRLICIIFMKFSAFVRVYR